MASNGKEKIFQSNPHELYSFIFKSPEKYQYKRQFAWNVKEQRKRKKGIDVQSTIQFYLMGNHLFFLCGEFERVPIYMPFLLVSSSDDNIIQSNNKIRILTVI